MTVAFKFIKDHEVNYTFILPASGALPRIFKQRREVGVRLAQHPIGRLLAEHLGNPLITSSLPIEDEDEPEYCTNPELIDERYGNAVYTILDAGDTPAGSLDDRRLHRGALRGAPLWPWAPGR